MVRITLALILSFSLTTLALTPNNAGARDVSLANGQQFTTGGCTTDADCQSTCCAEIGTTGAGICSAKAVATQNGKTGCGFIDPNATATIAAAQAQIAEQGFRRVVRKTSCKSS